MGQAAVYKWFRHFKKNRQLLEYDPHMGKGHYEPHLNGAGISRRANNYWRLTSK
jgi:hypothetical protein